MLPITLTIKYETVCIITLTRWRGDHISSHSGLAGALQQRIVRRLRQRTQPHAACQRLQVLACNNQRALNGNLSKAQSFLSVDGSSISRGAPVSSLKILTWQES